MKKLLSFIIIASVLLNACKKSNSPGPNSKKSDTTTDVYITGGVGTVGISNTKPAYAKNGVVTQLQTDTGTTGIAYAIAVNGNDVYAAGTSETNKATYWKNGVRYLLQTPGNKPAFALAIAIKGGDVYIAGYYNIDDYNTAALLWKNGVPATLAINTPASQAIGIALDGNDVYVCGSAVVNNVNKVVYWKNSVWHPVDDSGLNSFPRAITVKNGHVYLAGLLNGVVGAPRRACYWKDGYLTLLDQGDDVNSIVIDNNNNVYIGGISAGNACYWRNDQIVIFPSISIGTFIALAGNNVYTTALINGTNGGYYKNNTPVLLTASTTSFVAVYGIVVAQHLTIN